MQQDVSNLVAIIVRRTLFSVNELILRVHRGLTPFRPEGDRAYLAENYANHMGGTTSTTKLTKHTRIPSHQDRN